MKYVLIVIFFLSGCGYSSRGETMIGQVKSIEHVTPILCPDYIAVHFSLGITRNGTGAISTEDVVFYLPDSLEKDVHLPTVFEPFTLLVVDTYRITFCIPQMVIRSATAVE